MLNVMLKLLFTVFENLFDLSLDRLHTPSAPRIVKQAPVGRFSLINVTALLFRWLIHVIDQSLYFIQGGGRVVGSRL